MLHAFMKIKHIHQPLQCHVHDIGLPEWHAGNLVYTTSNTAVCFINTEDPGDQYFNHEGWTTATTSLLAIQFLEMMYGHGHAAPAVIEVYILHILVDEKSIMYCSCGYDWSCSSGFYSKFYWKEQHIFVLVTENEIERTHDSLITHSSFITQVCICRLGRSQVLILLTWSHTAAYLQPAMQSQNYLSH